MSSCIGREKTAEERVKKIGAAVKGTRRAQLWWFIGRGCRHEKKKNPSADNKRH